MNPPKLMRNTTIDADSRKADMNKFCDRISQLFSLADSIHLTDSVLGIPRVPSISAAQEIIKLHPSIKLRCSIRVRDRNLSTIVQLVSDAIVLGIEGLLIVKGDKPEGPSVDSGLHASYVVKVLNEQGFGDKIKLFLSVPQSPVLNKIQKKVEAKPFGFITQSISSLDHLHNFIEHAKNNNITVIPTIMIPSPKNRTSARLIGLDWREYENYTYSFVQQACEICGEVLISSPNSFNEGIDLLSKVKGELS